MQQPRASRWWIGTATLALVVPAVWALQSRVFGLAEARRDFHGVWLGMTTHQVRERYALPGSWSTATQPDGLVVLQWLPAAEESDVTSARFEVHQGLLVAVRAELAAGAPRHLPPLEVASDLVQTSEIRPDGTTYVRLIARNCPLHAAEVAPLLASTPNRPLSP